MMYSIFIPCDHGLGLVPKDLLENAGVAGLASDCGPEWQVVEEKHWKDVRQKRKDARLPNPARHGRLITWRKGKPENQSPPAGDPGFENLDWYGAPPAAAGGWCLREKGDPIRHLAGAYWVGINREAMPTPGECQRISLHEGYGVTLSDGRSWVVPSAWAAPATSGVDPKTGFWGEKIDKDWIAYCRTAAAHAEEFFGLAEAQNAIIKLYQGAELSPEELTVLGEMSTEGQKIRSAEDIDWAKLQKKIAIHDVAQQALTAIWLNYRVNPWIATVLELFKDVNIMLSVICAAFDRNHIADCLKKNIRARQVSLPVGWTISPGDTTQVAAL